MKRRATIKDIARALDVSIGTVDRALHNRPGINEETRRKVIEKAQEMGYKTNKLASTLARRKTTLIGAVFPRKIECFYDRIEKGMKKAERELFDFNVKLISCRPEHLGPEAEMYFLNALKKEKVDGIILCPGHRTKLNPLINQLYEENIPVVTLATDAPDSKRITCVCPDAYENGQIAGEMMAKMIDQPGKVAILTGFEGVEDHEEKIRGFSQVIKEMGKHLEIAAVVETYDEQLIAYQVAKQLIEKYNQELRGIYVNTANISGACKAVDEAGLSGKVKVIGSGIYKDNIRYLQKGTLQAAIPQSPEIQGYQAVMILYKYLRENYQPPPFSYVKPEVILKYNVHYFIQ